jgi:dephospho-CoA kinase
MRIALTGGIACGKSTAAKIFASLGCATLSTDALAHETLNAHDIAAQIRKHFGPSTLNPDGSVNRKTLGNLVFNHAESRLWLEKLVHPAINQRWQALTLAEPDKIWVVEIPLLFEGKLETLFEAVVCVHCTEETQLARMAARNLPEPDARARLQAQYPLGEKMRRAAFCLFNEGSLAFLREQAVRCLCSCREGR